MTLKEMEIKVLSLIEELDDTKTTKNYTQDSDIDKKIRECINIIMIEMSRIKKIHNIKTVTVAENQSYILNTEILDFYQLSKIAGVEYEIFGNEVTFLESGVAKIYYYKYPKLIKEDDNDSTYKFELSLDALEIMPYGVAGLVLANDPSTAYGKIYTNQYDQKKQYLDSRQSLSFNVQGGFNV